MLLETDFQTIEGEQMLQPETASGFKTWLMNFLGMRGRGRALNEQDKINAAKARWNKIKRLRHIITTRLIIQQNQEEQFE